MTKPTPDAFVMIACGLALFAAMTVASAQPLVDPTKPPAGIDKPAAAEAQGEEKPAAGLQTIIRRKGEKPAAVINGEYVTLGGRVGEARVVRIGEDSVTLRSATGTEVMKLAPGIEKSGPAAAKAGGKEAAK